MGYTRYFLINGIMLYAALTIIYKNGLNANVFEKRGSALQQVFIGILIASCFLLGIVCINVIGFQTIPRLFGFVQAGWADILCFVALQALIAVTEETIFRGLLSAIGKKCHLNGWVIIIGSAVLFGVFHWIFNYDLFQMVFSIVLGFVFSTLYMKNKYCSIYALMLAHFLYNIAIS